MSGYSKTPLVQKLGIKPGFHLAILNAPAGYERVLVDLPAGITQSAELGHGLDFVQFFCRERAQLEQRFPELKAALKPAGMLWISWPKGTSKVPTNLNENIIREIGLENGLVDVKVAAVDDDWSGLKFIYRLKDRP